MLNIQLILTIILIDFTAKIFTNHLFKGKTDNKWLKRFQFNFESDTNWNISYKTYGFPPQIKDDHLRNKFEYCEKNAWLKYEIHYKILVSYI